MKMSDTQGGYKLDEAQAILSEMKALKKAITSGEKEKQDLIQVLKQDDYSILCHQCSKIEFLKSNLRILYFRYIIEIFININ